MKPTSRIRMKATVAGTSDVASALNGIRSAIRNRVLRDAGKKQAGRAAKVEKAYLSARRTGQLGRSIGYVYRSYKSRTVWVYVIGPRHGFRIRVRDLTDAGQRSVMKRLGKRGRRKLSIKQTNNLLWKWVDPAKYAHLVENGRKAVRPTKKRVMSSGAAVYGRRAMVVTGRPFAAPAAAAVAASKDEMTADIWAAIEREAAKNAKKGRGIHS